MVDTSTGLVDRKRLGAIVFADKGALKQLESILHPAAKASQKDFIRIMRAKSSAKLNLRNLRLRLVNVRLKKVCGGIIL